MNSQNTPEIDFDAYSIGDAITAFNDKSMNPKETKVFQEILGRIHRYASTGSDCVVTSAPLARKVRMNIAARGFNVEEVCNSRETYYKIGGWAIGTGAKA